ncbi:uncharacterized protein LOC115757590 isoform X3 [Rhodamnia argentea]|uniref:Uncharacterized protein LOC115757590 isoform X3 n=1 Tax=Rhodamnia argentea TaxID=178133 RepID=A0ABM3H707_9MYRT|nr:uncharacterized protein LOC115757590 isoform X3 [Rhodamnia argentea]
MPLSGAPGAGVASLFPLQKSHLSDRELVSCLTSWRKNSKIVRRDFRPLRSSASGESRSSVEVDVPFPRDYDELLEQAKQATELAICDNRQLMEIEFPTSGLDSVPGDGEGGIEMTGSMQLIREFCDQLVDSEKVTRTRIVNFGFTEKVKMTDRVRPEDELFLVAYPYFNVNEMLVVEELYREAVANTGRKLIIFNGELDRIRSGYYPAFFYPKLAVLTKTLFPKMETVYYIHNFKGMKGGTLFRCYPGPWKVLRRVGNRYMTLHQQEAMPSLKEVALNILPSS